MTCQTGESLPPFEKTFHSYDLMAYGAATWDWYDVHYDRQATERQGLPAPFVDGQHLGALFAKQLRDHFGPQAFLAEMDLRFHSLVHAGDHIRAEAEIIEAPTPQTRRVLQSMSCAGRRVASATSVVALHFPPLDGEQA